MESFCLSCFKLLPCWVGAGGRTGTPVLPPRRPGECFPDLTLIMPPGLFPQRVGKRQGPPAGPASVDWTWQHCPGHGVGEADRRGCFGSGGGSLGNTWGASRLGVQGHALLPGLEDPQGCTGQPGLWLCARRPLQAGSRPVCHHLQGSGERSCPSCQPHPSLAVFWDLCLSRLPLEVAGTSRSLGL